MSVQGGAHVPLSTGDLHQYVALAHGPDMEVGVPGAETSEGLRRSILVQSTECERKFHALRDVSPGFFGGKNWRSVLIPLLLALCCVAAALLSVGVIRSVIDEAVETASLSSSRGAADDVRQQLTDPPEGVLPYTTRRPAFHVRPERNWISDPCGPFYFNGIYHVFYQYNPLGAYWGGNMSWGHSTSTDLIHWAFQGTALEPSEWYDINGAWSGSVTLVNNVPTALYSTQTETYRQLLGVAYPANLSDPLLREWKKDPRNPILAAPPGVVANVFRDPSTGWKGADGKWRVVLGTFFEGANDGVALLFKSDDFIHWEYQQKTTFFFTRSSGLLECLDTYPVYPLLDHPHHQHDSASGIVKFLFKVSLQDERHDWYSLGTYDEENDRFVPDNPDHPITQRFDQGKFFASKSFFDPVRNRRIIWGYVNESDPEPNDILKGWNTILGIPRTVWLDSYTNSSIITLPVDEVKSLRHSKVSKKAIQLAPCTVVLVEGAIGDQLDIEIVFDYPDVSKAFEQEQGKKFGPFGLLVFADQNFQEQSALYFDISYRENEGWITQYFSDPGRSTLAKEIDTNSYSALVKLRPSEDFLSARILVDRTVVESFVQGGRMTMTTRSYPTKAYGSNAHVFLFNNGTTPINLRSLVVWQMDTASNELNI